MTGGAFLLLAALQAAPAVPAQVPGFTAEGLAAATPEAATATRAALMRLEDMRAALALDPARALTMVQPLEAAALRRALGEADPGGAAHISFFMRGAMTRIARDGNGLIAGWYNPLLDIWLLAMLAPSTEGLWGVARATLVLGEELRGDHSVWTSAEANPFGVLAANSRASLDAFDRRFGTARARVALGDGFLALASRSAAWLDSLGAWRSDLGGLAAAEGVRTAIAEGRLGHAGWAGRELARQVDALPRLVRSTMAIVGAARRGEGNAVLLGSPAAPELVLVLDLDAGDAPRTLTIVNLVNRPGGMR